MVMLDKLPDKNMFEDSIHQQAPVITGELVILHDIQ